MKSFVVLLSLILGSEMALPAGRQLTGPYTPAASPPLLPLEAQKKFVVPEGFEVRLFAAEPDVINPVAMTWDERGRLWVLELYEYPLGAPPGTKPRDRIKILEDTDNDGVADKVTVFADGLNLATGLALGNGGIYVGQAPDFLFLQDTNHDDKADTKTVLLTGFGLDDRHELLNGFTWGPDGWLYMTHGVFTHSRVKIPEASAPGVEVTAAVARFQPSTKKFEVFADGTSNPWGVDFDRYGNAFVSACVIDHLFHMAPGGIYVRQGGVPANPYAYELLPSIVDHKHHMAAYCGICIYQGDQFPEEYRGHVFMGNIHQNAINHDRLIPNGSSFKAVAEKDFLTTSDGWFRPISEQVGPDGALWIGDWYDKYPCYQNAQADPEGVDRERGRIWRVVYTEKNPGKKMPSRPNSNMNLAQASSLKLIELLERPNEWQRRTAQRLLSERASKLKTESSRLEIQGALEEILTERKTLENRLSALWTLHNSGLFSVSTDFQKFSNDPTLLSWGARFDAENLRKIALDQGEVGTAFAGASAKLLSALEKSAADASPSVRLAVATAVRELVSDSLSIDTEIKCNYQIGGILAALIKSSADAKDPLLPFMIWMAGEPTFAKNPEGGLKWLAENGADTMPLSGILTRKAMRRICDMQDAAKLDLAVEFLSQIAGKDGGFILAAIDGLIEGQKAKPVVPKADTRELFAKLTANSDAKVQIRARELGTLWGNAASIQATIAAVNDATLSTDERAQAIEAVKALKNAASTDALLKLVNGNNPESLVIQGMRALGQVGGDNIANDFLQSWNKFSPAAKAAAADVLVSRWRWVTALLSALESKTVSPQDLSLTAIRSLGDSKNDFIRQRATQVIGRIRPADGDKQKVIEQKKKMILSGGPADLQAGHEIAKKTCFVCHKLYGEGADVGPDLTGVGRSTLDALLANVIDPNQVIGKGYENVQVETKDGRSLSGRLVEETDSGIKLLSSGPKEDVIAKSDIASRRVSELSVMPEGLEQMPDADFRNLISYILHPPQDTAH
jgi:putative membrane-bound dehydrogenase-like protein